MNSAERELAEVSGTRRNIEADFAAKLQAQELQVSNAMLGRYAGSLVGQIVYYGNQVLISGLLLVN